jgi:hypothetical protein
MKFRLRLTGLLVNELQALDDIRIIVKIFGETSLVVVGVGGTVDGLGWVLG